MAGVREEKIVVRPELALFGRARRRLSRRTGVRMNGKRVMPVGEVLGAIEGTKGNNGYYLVSDGSTVSYRTRIRTPSFAHVQTLQLLSRGLMIPDLVVNLGSLDFVLADVDR